MKTSKKKCSRCGIVKSRMAFGLRRTDGTDGHRSQCKKCNSVDVATRRLGNLSVARESGLAAYEREKAAKPEVVRLRARKSALKHRYQMTLEEFETLFARQGGLCAACSGALTSGRGTNVDHDHDCCPGRSCGKCVRGLLCRACNHTLGHSKDDPARLRACAAYLEATRLRMVA